MNQEAHRALSVKRRKRKNFDLTYVSDRDNMRNCYIDSFNNLAVVVSQQAMFKGKCKQSEKEKWLQSVSIEIAKIMKFLLCGSFSKNFIYNCELTNSIDELSLGFEETITKYVKDASLTWILLECIRSLYYMDVANDRKQYAAHLLAYICHFKRLQNYGNMQRKEHKALFSKKLRKGHVVFSRTLQKQEDKDNFVTDVNQRAAYVLLISTIDEAKDIFHFVEVSKRVNMKYHSSSGLSRRKRLGISRFYITQLKDSSEKLLKLVKSPIEASDNWTHSDILRLCHTSTPNDERAKILKLLAQHGAIQRKRAKSKKRKNIMSKDNCDFHYKMKRRFANLKLTEDPSLRDSSLKTDFIGFSLEQARDRSAIIQDERRKTVEHQYDQKLLAGKPFTRVDRHLFNFLYQSIVELQNPEIDVKYATYLINQTNYGIAQYKKSIELDGHSQTYEKLFKNCISFCHLPASFQDRPEIWHALVSTAPLKDILTQMPSASLVPGTLTDAVLDILSNRMKNSRTIAPYQYLNCFKLIRDQIGIIVNKQKILAILDEAFKLSVISYYSYAHMKNGFEEPGRVNQLGNNNLKMEGNWLIVLSAQQLQDQNNVRVLDKLYHLLATAASTYNQLAFHACQEYEMKKEAYIRMKTNMKNKTPIQASIETFLLKYCNFAEIKEVELVVCSGERMHTIKKWAFDKSADNTALSFDEIYQKYIDLCKSNNVLADYPLILKQIYKTHISSVIFIDEQFSFCIKNKLLNIIEGRNREVSMKYRSDLNEIAKKYPNGCSKEKTDLKNAARRKAFFKHFTLWALDPTPDDCPDEYYKRSNRFVLELCFNGPDAMRLALQSARGSLLAPRFFPCFLPCGLYRLQGQKLRQEAEADNFNRNDFTRYFEAAELLNFDDIDEQINEDFDNDMSDIDDIHSDDRDNDFDDGLDGSLHADDDIFDVDIYESDDFDIQDNIDDDYV